MSGAAGVFARLVGAAPRGELGRLPIAVNLRAVSIAEGVRAALSVAVIIGISDWLDQPLLLAAALGSLLTCMCDVGGPIRRRVPVLLSFAIVGAALTAVMGLARAGGFWVALPVGVVGLFCLQMARIYGQAGLQMGGLLSAVLVLGLDHPLTLREAGVLGGLFLAGGLWAVLLTMVIWRTHPFLPARRAVGEAYRQLAEMVADLRALIASETTDDAAWERHARGHRASVRDAIEAARNETLDAVRAMGASNHRSAQSLIRLEAVDQIFGAMIALSEHLEQNVAARAGCDRVLRRMRPLLIVLGAVVVDDFAKIEPLRRSLDNLAADIALLAEASPERAILEMAAERLRIAVTLAAPADYVPGTGLDGKRRKLRARVLGPLKANLNWDSLPLRHALRAIAVGAPALAYTLVWFNPYAHWLTITIVVTMQPYFAATFTRALERIGGTVLGGVLAAVVGVFCHTPMSMLIALFPLCVIALAIRTVSFGLFMVGLTPLVVLLVEFGEPGQSEWVVLFMRTGFTLAGGLLALAGCYLLWPSWEPARLRQEVTAGIAAHGRYAEAELSYLLGEADAAAAERARRAAGLSTNNIEASVSRAMLEPIHTERDKLEAAMVIDAALRRLAGRLSAMQLEPGLRDALGAETLRGWRDWIGASMRSLAAGQGRIAARPPLAPGPRAEAMLRIARQIELMAAVVDRAVGVGDVASGGLA
jgi:uncharacterized membrane protein YccC